MIALFVRNTGQIFAQKFNPFLYWLTIIASTTVGTTLADFVNRSLGIGYTGGSFILFTLLMGSLFVWHRLLGTVEVGSVSSPKSEFFYWLTITFSQTLGTALGDWTADTAKLGYLGGAVIFSGLLVAVTLAYLYTAIPHTILFWTAFILTRPLGAVVGDFLDKPHAKGGLELSRYSATAVLVALILTCILVIPQRAARKAH
ncbi:COG4705 family protein [Microcystis aeruginosa]|uniref:Integral membrane protein n=1 Tax=Microcystis aeruginosa PCC 9443 TaxID=1160281 RepID=I4G506_MICAE|nr:hypothetical protein [Microcystis aeruginosa]CCI03017.1 conserved membrane hypothetical protein [Microcystis aeruginosa PCC 9443]